MGAKRRVWCRVERPGVLVLVGFFLVEGRCSVFAVCFFFVTCSLSTQGKFQTADKREAADKAGL